MAGGGGTARLMGFGFLFGARDAGATRVMEDVKNKAKDVGDEFDDAKDKTRSFGDVFDRMVQGLQLHRLNQISDSLSGLAERAGSLMDVPDAFQATGIESFGASFSNTFRRATAGMGQFRSGMEEVRGEISSLSYSLDVSADDMIATNAAVVRAGQSLDDYGISQRALAGMINAGLVSGQQFGDLLVSWSTGYGLGAEGAGRLADTMVALGERAGDVGGVLQGLPGIMQALDTAGAEFPAIADNMDTWAESTVRLAVAMQQQGLGPLQETMGQATSVFTELVGQRRNLSNLFTGLGSDFGQLATALGVATGDVGGAVEAATSDPIRFASAVNEMFDGMDPTMAQRLRSELTAMGPGFGFLISGGEESATVLAQMQQPLENVSGAVERVGGAAAHTSRTLAESMERQSDAFQMRYRRMVRDAVGGAGNILEVQRRGFQGAINTLETWSAGNGPLGRFGASATNAFFRAQTGLHGLVATFDTLGGPALDTLSEMAPALSVLGGVATTAGRSFGALRGVLGGMMLPIALVAGGAYLLYRNWDRLSEIADQVTERVLSFSRTLADLAPRIRAWVDNINWYQIGTDIVEGILSVFSDAGDAIEGDHSAAQEVGANVGVFFREVARAGLTVAQRTFAGMWDMVVEWITEPEDLAGQVQRGGQALGATVLGGLGVAMFSGAGRSALMRAIVSGGERIFSMMSRVFSGIGGGGRAAGGMLGGGRMMLRRLPYIGAVIGLLFDLPEIISQFRTGDIEGAFLTTFRSIVNGLLFGIPDMLESFLGFDFITTIFEGMFQGSGLGGIARGIEQGDWGDVIANAMWFSLNAALGGFPMLIRGALSEIFGQDVIGGGLSAITDLFGDIVSAFDDIVSPMYEAWVLAWEEISIEAQSLWDDTLEPMLSDMRDGFKQFIDWVTPYAVRAWNRIKQGFEMAFDAISVALGFVANNIFDTFRAFATVGAAVAGLVARNFINGFFAVMQAIVEFRTRWTQFKNYMSDTMEVLGLSIRNFFMVPFLRAGHVIMTIQETLSTSFNSLKLVFLGLLDTILTGITDMLRGFGPLGEAAASALAGPVRSVQTQIAAQTRENRVQENRIAAERERRQGELVSAEQQLADAEAHRVRRFDAGQEQAARESANVRRMREASLRGVERFGEAMDTAGERIADVFTAEGRAAARARRDERRTAEQEARRLRTLDALEPALQALQSARERGAISDEQLATMSERFSGAIESGQEFSDGQLAAFRETINEIPGAIEGRRGREARRSEAAGATAASAVGSLFGDEPVVETGQAPVGRQIGPARASRRDAVRRREEARANREQSARDEAVRQVLIASFSPEARNQMSRAMTVRIGGGPARPTPPGGM